MADDSGWGLDDLDGNASSLVSHRLGAWDLMIGGGPDAYIVTATGEAGARVANALSSVALDDDATTVDLTVGGQAVDYPRKCVLTRDEALAAIADLEADRLDGDRWEILE
ncbi:hypothetical protein MUN77_04010 [Leucobacter allii]|uniref:hypothetical protein n=1 Tax=Leucobacter allii TaxID=2932247 RepID=UPI001FD13B32|nr:hypothetical protein [Leucobacter allii]UOR02480.1 hypothetical protein MUN77_04010 [Leucobacter allii]